jgi:hypothetical protein
MSWIPETDDCEIEHRQKRKMNWLFQACNLWSIEFFWVIFVTTSLWGHQKKISKKTYNFLVVWGWWILVQQSRYHIPRHFQKSKLRRTIDVLTTVKPKLSRLEGTDPGSSEGSHPSEQRIRSATMVLSPQAECTSRRERPGRTFWMALVDQTCGTSRTSKNQVQLEVLFCEVLPSGNLTVCLVCYWKWP